MSRDKHVLQDRTCAQRSLRSACADAQADLRLHCPPEDALDPLLHSECLAKTDQTAWMHRFI